MTSTKTQKLLTISALGQLAITQNQYQLPLIDGVQLSIQRRHGELYIVEMTSNRKLPWSELPDELLDRIIRNLSLRLMINQPHLLN